MPRVDWNRATYNAAYRCVLNNRVEHNGVVYPAGSVVGMGRALYLDTKGSRPRFNTWHENVRQLGVKVNLSFGSSILVVGAGFGYTIEEAMALGVTKIWGIDTSSYIHEDKAVEAGAGVRGRIINADIMAPDILNTLKGFVGGSGRVNWVVTELVLESLLPEELAPFLNACDGLRTGPGGVAHIVATLQETPEGGLSPHKDSALWYRTLEEWAAERPGHFWLDADNDYRVLGGG